MSNPALITITKKVNFKVNELLNANPFIPKSKLSNKEQLPLNELSNNQGIIIHPVDKVGTVVVLFKDKYIRGKAHCQLDTKLKDYIAIPYWT